MISGCSVTDGDTISCGDERIRLLGINAPELPSHCAEYRTCATGGPYASTRSLVEAMQDPLRIKRVRTDRYGRTLARGAGAKGDLSCWQLDEGQAQYIAKRDDGYFIKRAGPNALQLCGYGDDHRRPVAGRAVFMAIALVVKRLISRK